MLVENVVEKEAVVFRAAVGWDFSTVFVGVFAADADADADAMA
ncbi:MAG: hypothetical protein QM756_43070 [Polyangiaceae bacterium]